MVIWSHCRAFGGAARARDPVRRKPARGFAMSRKKQRLLVTALAAGLLLVALRVRADSACIPDVQRYCSAIPIGEGRVLTCLQARWRDLAGACQQEIQQIQKRANEVTSACTGDVWQYCGN